MQNIIIRLEDELIKKWFPRPTQKLWGGPNRLETVFADRRLAARTIRNGNDLLQYIIKFHPRTLADRLKIMICTFFPTLYRENRFVGDAFL